MCVGEQAGGICGARRACGRVTRVTVGTANAVCGVVGNTNIVNLATSLALGEIHLGLCNNAALRRPDTVCRSV